MAQEKPDLHRTGTQAGDKTRAAQDEGLANQNVTGPAAPAEEKKPAGPEPAGLVDRNITRPSPPDVERGR
ncbi:MAG TPA: hypothetical protein VEC01_01170 [Noviherbaspirillum sp.]|uniref:hypothetical protein n=1 Tax=Noviherbaspirillum sp. TaxID=1926288 RepID=UPI002D469CC3|nr:hypothetical protein [Noviherbaspirillum sp.]HYD93905.1 hypothetical protein [Noviherbaspirillum sp.]